MKDDGWHGLSWLFKPYVKCFIFDGVIEFLDYYAPFMIEFLLRDYEYDDFQLHRSMILCELY